MRHYFSTRVRVVLVLAVALAAVLAVLSGVLNISIPDMMVKTVLTPIRTAASKLTDQAERIYSYMFRYEALSAENDALKAQIAQMEDATRQADSLARENDRLKKMLNFSQSHEDFTYLPAYIISWSSNDWTNTLTVNRGTNDGINAGMCAITETGNMVGLVTEAGPNYAVIKTVLDSTLEVNATVSSSGYNGIVQGNYVAGRRDLLRMDYLPTSSVIRNRDQVVTTGSTTYPRGLVIGYVVDADFDDSGVAKFALLEPAADIVTLEQVFIVTAFGES